MTLLLFISLNRSNRGLNPRNIAGHINIDARHSTGRTANTPGHQTRHIPSIAALADQRGSSIASARVLRRLSTRTHKARRIEEKARTQASGAQLCLTLCVGQDRHIHLLLNRLIRTRAREIILPPSGDKAAGAHECGRG